MNRPQRPGCPWDVPNLSLGRFRGIPTTKFLYVIFLYRFFLLPNTQGRHAWISKLNLAGFGRELHGCRMKTLAILDRT